MLDATHHASAGPSPAMSFGAWLHERTALLQGLLDAIGRPTAVLAADRTLIACSRSARTELHRCLVICAGRIGGFAGATSERFDVAFARTLLGCRCDVALVPGRGERPWRLNFAPLAEGAWLNSEFARAAVVVTIDAPRERGDLNAIARLYRLTNAEMRVLALLLEGGTTAEIAAEMRIAMTTLRSYLKALFQKTQTRRQAELVRLAAQIGGT